MGDMMTFPASVEEFMEQYKMTDTEHVYSNGTEYVPIYRMKQWFEHCFNQQLPVIRCKDCTFGHYIDYGHMHCLHPCGLTTNMSDDFCSYAERKE